MANGSTDRTVKYWDLESMENISKSGRDSTPISHICFSTENPDHLFACSAENIRLWNIETNQALDCLGLPPKPVADFRVSFSKRFLFLTTIQANTLTVYFSSLDNINFDESVDTVPMLDQDMIKVDKVVAKKVQENEK